MGSEELLSWDSRVRGENIPFLRSRESPERNRSRDPCSPAVAREESCPGDRSFRCRFRLFRHRAPHPSLRGIFPFVDLSVLIFAQQSSLPDCRTDDRCPGFPCPGRTRCRIVQWSAASRCIRYHSSGISAIGTCEDGISKKVHPPFAASIFSFERRVISMNSLFVQRI